MMMRDRPVVVSLRQAIMRVETLSLSAVVVRVHVAMARRDVVAVRVPVIGHGLDIVVVVAVDNRHVVVILVSQFRQMLHIDRQMMTVVEDRSC